MLNNIKTIEEAAKYFAACALMDYDAEKELNGEVDVEEFSIECFKSGVEFAQQLIRVKEEFTDQSMEIEKIKEMPTVVENRHESLFKSYHVLEKARQMLERGDSKETILDVIEFLYSK